MPGPLPTRADEPSRQRISVTLGGAGGLGGLGFVEALGGFDVRLLLWGELEQVLDDEVVPELDGNLLELELPASAFRLLGLRRSSHSSSVAGSPRPAPPEGLHDLLASGEALGNAKAQGPQLLLDGRLEPCGATAPLKHVLLDSWVPHRGPIRRPTGTHRPVPLPGPCQ